MKKTLLFCSALLLMLTAISSCKKSDTTDDADFPDVIENQEILCNGEKVQAFVFDGEFIFSSAYYNPDSKEINVYLVLRDINTKEKIDFFNLDFKSQSKPKAGDTYKEFNSETYTLEFEYKYVSGSIEVYKYDDEFFKINFKEFKFKKKENEYVFDGKLTLPITEAVG